MKRICYYLVVILAFSACTTDEVALENQEVETTKIPIETTAKAVNCDSYLIDVGTAQVPASDYWAIGGILMDHVYAPSQYYGSPFSRYMMCKLGIEPFEVANPPCPTQTIYLTGNGTFSFYDVPLTFLDDVTVPQAAYHPYSDGLFTVAEQKGYVLNYIENEILNLNLSNSRSLTCLTGTYVVGNVEVLYSSIGGGPSINGIYIYARITLISY